MSAALPRVAYLDDLQDGVSSHMLQELGVSLKCTPATAAAAKPDAATPHATAAAPRAWTFGATCVHPSVEHAYEHGVKYSVVGAPAGTCAVVDVRDSADAWLRFQLVEGDELCLPPRMHHRLPQLPAHAGVVVDMPTWAADADRKSRQSTVRFASRFVPVTPGAGVQLPTLTHAEDVDAPIAPAVFRFVAGSAEEADANVPHFLRPGTQHRRNLVVELCESFYHLGWVTGTGGSISIRHGNRIFMAPSGVQKERMQPQDIFVLDTAGQEVYAPQPLPGKPRLGLSQCAPLFQHAFTLRNAGACIHTHDVHAVMCTLQNDYEFRITHQEMIKGIAGHGFVDDCVVPIIENTAHERDLADSLGEAMNKYPRANAVLVRRHGVYVWGNSWEAAKTQAECYHYLFDVATRMRSIDIDPAHVPAAYTQGIGAATSYDAKVRGTASGAASGIASGAASGAAAVAQAGNTCPGGCCGGPRAAPLAAGAGAGAGFHGAAGVHATLSTVSASSHADAAPVPWDLSRVKAVVLDIEGTTTPLAFVTDKLFPYAAAALEAHVHRAWGTPELVSDVEALVTLSASDVASGMPGASDVALPALLASSVADAAAPASVRDEAVRVLAANVRWQMSANRKTAALKALQGHIWRAGYESGEIVGDLFDDVLPAFRAWNDACVRVYIYSSGSREAQRLLFAHTSAGDVRRYLSGYFDTVTGGKLEAASYASIAAHIGVDSPSELLFVTDVLPEAVASNAAGWQTALITRPGNVALPAAQPFHTITSFSELHA